MNDRRFRIALALMGGCYVLLIAAMIVADVNAMSLSIFTQTFARADVRYALMLSLLTSIVSAWLALLIGLPLAYLLARWRFWGRGLILWLVELPLVLPPLVIGLSLLILMRTRPGQFVEGIVPFTYSVFGIVLAQFAVVTAFVVRSLRGTFSDRSFRSEEVARTLGCTRAQAFRRVTLRESQPGIQRALTLAWARAFGEFGPILLFAGVTRFRTEVLPTTIFLELSVGQIEAALAVSVVMMGISGIIVYLLRESDSIR